MCYNEKNKKSQKSCDEGEESMILNATGFVFTNYILDIVVVLALLGFGFICGRRGFIDCFFGFVSTIVALIVAVLLTNSVLEMTNGLFGLQGSLQGSFEGAFLKIEGFDLDVSNGGIEAALTEKNLPGFLIKLVIDTFGNEEIAAGTTLAMIVGQTAASVTVSLVTGLALFLIVKLVMIILKGILNSLAENISLIGSLNVLLGFVVGLIQGVLLVYAVLALVSLIPSESITTYLDNSLFVGWLYHNNLVNMVLGWLIG